MPSMPWLREGTQYAVAVFDTWQALESLLRELAEANLSCRGTLLHARGDPPPPTLPGTFGDAVQLRFSGLRVTCTQGDIAQLLASRRASAANSLAHALQSWLSPDQALHLQGHVERGHLLLWLNLTVDDSLSICARLVQASPHVVEVSSMTANYRA
jgi:hypothetical protein